MSSPKPSLFSLPDELLLSCVARISRLYYPTLSLVSIRFRSLLVSPELYKVRSLLGHKESCLYVCLNFYPDHRWFTLCRKPDTKSSGYVLATVPSPHSPRRHCWSLSVGSYIYNIDSSTFSSDSSDVSILDCRSHTWLEGPSLPVELVSSCFGSVVDQKIYVAGSSWENEKLVCVLDTKTQIWDVVDPCKEIELDNLLGSACIDGKFHLKYGHGEVIAYDSKKGKWDLVERRMGTHIYRESCCEIDNVLYSFNWGVFRWYDTKVRLWRELKGLSQFDPHPYVTLTDYGGKMAVTWIMDALNEKTIWCMEISLERRSTSEIWGIVEWFDHMVIPGQCSLVQVVAATV